MAHDPSNDCCPRNADDRNETCSCDGPLQYGGSERNRSKNVKLQIEIEESHEHDFRAVIGVVGEMYAIYSTCYFDSPSTALQVAGNVLEKYRSDILAAAKHLNPLKLDESQKLHVGDFQRTSSVVQKPSGDDPFYQ
jgi:hypothetical protein